MSKYAKGTQAMLDAAKNDATLLPFDTVFILNSEKVIRDKEHHSIINPVIIMVSVNAPLFYHAVTISDILPAKKQKKAKRVPWQNGTQEALDIAKDDARLIPKKTYFMSKIRTTNGKIVYRIPFTMNDKISVLMVSSDYASIECHAAEDLEPIKEE